MLPTQAVMHCEFTNKHDQARALQLKVENRVARFRVIRIENFIHSAITPNPIIVSNCGAASLPMLYIATLADRE